MCVQLKRQTEPVGPARRVHEKSPDLSEGLPSGWHSVVCLIPGESVYGLPIEIEPFHAVLKGLQKQERLVVSLFMQSISGALDALTDAWGPTEREGGRKGLGATLLLSGA